MFAGIEGAAPAWIGGAEIEIRAPPELVRGHGDVEGVRGVARRGEVHLIERLGEGVGLLG